MRITIERGFHRLGLVGLAIGAAGGLVGTFVLSITSRPGLGPFPWDELGYCLAWALGGVAWYGLMWLIGWLIRGFVDHP